LGAVAVRFGVMAAHARTAVVRRRTGVVGAVQVLGAMAAAVRAARGLVPAGLGLVAPAVVSALQGAGGSDVVRAFGQG
jgi:hypothetical protein